MKERKMVSILLSCVLLIGIGQLGLCAMSGCAQDYGVLYHLQDVYDAQGIDRDDLLNIAYHNGDIENNQEALQGFTPEPIGELSENTAQKIRECLARIFREDYEINATEDGFKIVKYLGCYNEYFAFRFTDSYFDYPAVDDEPQIQVIDEIQFLYWHTSQICLWKEN